MRKSHFKAPEGKYRIDFEINATPKHKSGLRVKKGNVLNATKVDYLKVKNTQYDRMYVTVNADDKLLVYELAENNLEPITYLNCCGGRAVCHKLSKPAAANSQLELLIGFDSGDIAVHNTLNNVYTLFNKDRQIDNSSVRAVCWDPLRANVFAASHDSGNLFIYDKHFHELESPIQIQQTANNTTASTSKAVATATAPQSSSYYYSNRSANQSINSSSNGSSSSNSNNSEDVVTKAQIDRFVAAHNKTPKTNPIAQIRLSNSPILDAKYSPNGRYIAAVSNDGYLRVVDLRTLSLVAVFKSWFGPLLCLSWSPDSKYIVTGGEDDLISIFDFQRKKVVGRGVGHSSWVSDVCFDSVNCDEERYRIVSVGHDAKMILWDIETDDDEDDEEDEVVDNNGGDASASSRMDIDSNRNSKYDVFVRSPPIKQVQMFEPVSVHQVHEEPVTSLLCFDDAIITACHGYLVKFWLRPHFE